MKFSITLMHDRLLTLPEFQPDITIDRKGKVCFNRPTMTPSTIAVDCPGLKPTYKQLLSLYGLVKGYEGLSFSGDAVVLDQPLMALKVLEAELAEKAPAT